MNLNTLKDLYIDELKDVYDAENQIVKALPKMAKEATNEELRAAIEQHLDQTQTQIERLEQIFEELGEKAKGTKCEATKGLLEEAKRMMDDAEDEDVRDAAIIIFGVVHHAFGFFQQTFCRLALGPFGFLAEFFKNLFQTFNLRLCLVEMLFNRRAQFLVGGFLGHLGESFDDLIFGVVNVFEFVD